MPEKHLLVEGNDDFHVVGAICKKYEIPINFITHDCRGITELLKTLPVRFKDSDSSVSTIGIIVDADIDIKARWHSLKNLLEKQGYSDVPDLPPESGLIINEIGFKKVGIWLMPNNNLNGILEDFIAFLVPTEDMLMPFVTNTLNEIEQRNLNNYNIIHRSKAKIHSWLALQEDPGTPLGSSITKKYLTTDMEICQRFGDWLNNLFN